ncbi:zinc finger MYM-type protein 1 [Caerostris darwini]|uniref:Zinc finger MYM-type protein 1 n=1 Tax=Caerostris darwini TaxID=1538125 RepID=A0AAV4RDX8_9ARAC|nr:zinc finger MYM-type protein 1 [Caerostris darwini]
MAEKVKDTIMEEVKNSGYFSFSIDSIPDISHTDQLTLIIRYVSPEDGLPTERFLTFLELKDHSGESIADLVFNYITTELNIDFRKSRGQSYDNTANMNVRYNGMQQKITEKKSLQDLFHALVTL